MRLPGEDEHRSMGASVVNLTMGIFIFMLILLYVVIKSNKNSSSGSEYVQNAMQQQQQESVAETPDVTVVDSDNKLRAEDLDFWDMYPVEDDEDKTQSSVADSNKSNEDSKPADIWEKEEVVQEDPSTDGKHTLVEYADGTEEWVLISPYLKKNSYDSSNFTETAGLLKYIENGKKISQVGVDVSKHNGTVNFKRLKAAGIDYVMIRLGARGYSTGQITLDENFVENIEAAIEAELNIGVYFYSQAINVEEAVQEAYFVIQNLEPYRAHITYPVAFDMEKVSNDKARIDGLSRDDKTTITSTFLDTIQAAGYTPMVYGNKEWLIKNVDLTKLQNYDMWLSQDKDTPDYPYLYTMWQYTTTGTVNGITGDAALNICFVNYSDR